MTVKLFHRHHDLPPPPPSPAPALAQQVLRQANELHKIALAVKRSQEAREQKK